MPKYVKKYLKIENNLVVIFQLSHFGKSGYKIFSIESFGWEGDQSDSSMISKIDEDIVLASWLKNLLSFSCSAISLEDSQKVLWGDICFGIINFDSFVNINSWVVVGGLVKNFALEGIANTFSNIVISKGDDSILRESIVSELFIGMEDIWLMPIVGVGVWTSNEDSPVVTEDSSGKKTDDENLHVDI